MEHKNYIYNHDIIKLSVSALQMSTVSNEYSKLLNNTDIKLLRNCKFKTQLNDAKLIDHYYTQLQIEFYAVAY